MSEVYYDIDGHADEFCRGIKGVGKQPVCSFCGNKANAYWIGHNTGICVCRNCALDVLPKLIADAVASNVPDSNLDAGYFQYQISQVVTNFWVGATSALSCRLKEWKGSTPPP